MKFFRGVFQFVVGKTTNLFFKGLQQFRQILKGLSSFNGILQGYAPQKHVPFMI